MVEPAGKHKGLRATLRRFFDWVDRNAFWIAVALIAFNVFAAILAVASTGSTKEARSGLAMTFFVLVMYRFARWIEQVELSDDADRERSEG